MGLYRAYLPMLGIGAGVVLALMLARKANLIPGAAEVFQGVAAGAVDSVDGALRGTVEGVGLMIGIPKTNKTQCQKDIQGGHMWDASFSCPAKDFLNAAWDRL